MWKLGLSSSYHQHCPYSAHWQKYKVGHMSFLKVYFQTKPKVLLCLQYLPSPHRLSIKTTYRCLCVIGKKGEFQNWENNLSGGNLSLFCEVQWWAILLYEELTVHGSSMKRGWEKQASFQNSHVTGFPWWSWQSYRRSPFTLLFQDDFCSDSIRAPSEKQTHWVIEEIYDSH